VAPPVLGFSPGRVICQLLAFHEEPLQGRLCRPRRDGYGFKLAKVMLHKNRPRSAQPSTRKLFGQFTLEVNTYRINSFPRKATDMCTHPSLNVSLTFLAVQVVYRASPSLFVRLRTRSDSTDEPFHRNANGIAATMRERDGARRQLALSHWSLTLQSGMRTAACPSFGPATTGA